MPRRDEVAYADNWRTVLAVDAGLGLVILVSGVVMSVARPSWAGYLLATVGFLYVAFVLRRYRRWKKLRLDAGRRLQPE